MTPENVNAQEKALEALVAASLRCPDKPPAITEEDIKRFVEQQVTLSAEDEAALAQSKPELMRRIRGVLNGSPERDKYCVSGSNTNHSAEVPMPRSLLDFAERKSLTVTQTRQLFGMRLEIIAHRGNSKGEDLEEFDWERFYRAVKPFLK
ncbi:MAG: hypothetical protein ABSA97_06630 [Verrucomicrobiia bacterium]